MRIISKRRWLARWSALSLLAASSVPLHAATGKDGMQKLDALFAEDMDFVVNQGGPYQNAEEIRRGADTLFWSITHPYCPHCPIAPPLSEQQERERLQRLLNDAREGVPEAQHELGVRYFLGQGLAYDASEGVAWIQKAADNGDTRATLSLAEMYDSGFGVAVDKQKAAALFQLLMQQPGNRSVTERLGEMYEFGLGVPVDYQQAMGLYQQAAAHAASTFSYFSQSAQFKIGRLYAQGKGVQQDYQMAAAWFLKSTEPGIGDGGMLPPSQCALAIMYATGLGVTFDARERDYWLQRPGTLNMKICQELEQEQETKQ